MITTAPRFIPPRIILITIFVLIFTLIGGLLFNRLAYTGIMTPMADAPEGVSYGNDKQLFITTNRFSQATRFGVLVQNTSPRTLSTITIDIRLLDDGGNVVGSTVGGGNDIPPGGSQWVRGLIDRSGPYTQADAEVSAVEWR